MGRLAPRETMPVPRGTVRSSTKACRLVSPWTGRHWQQLPCSALLAELRSYRTHWRQKEDRGHETFLRGRRMASPLQ